MTGISSSISSLLGLTTNGEVWVLVGLALWVGAHLELYILGAKVLGYVVTLILAVIPVLILGVLLYMFVRKLIAESWIEAAVFGVLAVACVVYFFLGGLKNDEVNKEDKEVGVKAKITALIENIKVLIKFEVFKSRPDDTIGKVMLLLGGAISILGVVALGLAAGWQFIQGSLAWGVGLAVPGLVVAVACRWPNQPWNLAAKAYSALAKISKDSATKDTGAPASVTSSG